ncbi:hypothetical protein [Methylobacterium oryzihabitans]|uniref:Uncharacterized protein n=1 Tax=Methylobacterium oryzihabitans TaxID=2499852 RepID=A0A437NR99_9HYPH|nr:hypothetical protein [Methylobacterium oryzihabitans]RVU12562.1 hypothetical protein EOE48_27505 [Methylobacterium oryzihabitans]
MPRLRSAIHGAVLSLAALAAIWLIADHAEHSRLRRALEAATGLQLGTAALSLSEAGGQVASR